jgi:hypothetical protein
MVGLLALFAYLALLVRWFNDPGQTTADGWVLRSRVVWPFALAFVGLAGASAYLSRARVACLARDLRRGLALGRVDWVILALLLMMAAAYQLPALLYAGGALNSDSVLPGIIAKHIADGRPAPAFIYTLGYGGTFASHLLALLYAVTGPSVAGLIVLVGAYHLIFVAIMFVMLRVSLGRTVATFAALFLALPPEFLLDQLQYTELAEMLAVGAAVAAILAARAADRVTDDAWYAIAGVLMGIGFWTQPLVTTAGLAGAATVFYFKGFTHTVGRFAVWFGGGALLGLMPAFVGWGWEVWDFAKWLVGSDADHVAARGTADVVAAVARTGLPTLFGSWREIELGGAAALLIAAVVVIPALCAIVAAVRLSAGGQQAGDQTRRHSAAVLLLLGLSVVIHVVVFLLSPFNDLIVPPRYLLPLYLGAPALLAWFLFAAMSLVGPRTARVAVATVFAGLVVVEAFLTAGRVDNLRQRHNAIHESYEILRAEGVRYSEAPYWDCYWLAFYSLEEIICMSRGVRRDPYYEQVVMTLSEGPYPHLVASLGDQWLADARAYLEEENIGHRYVRTPLFEVLVLDPVR